MKISRLSDEGAVEVVEKIADGLKAHFSHNPEMAKEFLEILLEEVIEPLSGEDFFGTEGWEHCFGLED